MSSVRVSNKCASSNRSPKLSNGSTTIERRGAVDAEDTEGETPSVATAATIGNWEGGPLIDETHHVTTAITIAAEAIAVVAKTAVRRRDRVEVGTAVAG